MASNYGSGATIKFERFKVPSELASIELVSEFDELGELSLVK